MVDEETKRKIEKLQSTENTLQQLLAKKQQFQSQIVEIESALGELDKTEQAYKIVGNIMVATAKDALRSDLDQKKEMLTLRVQSVEKQEKKLQEQAESLQKEVLAQMKEE